MRLLVSNSIYAKKDRNGPPSANQVASKDEHKCGHAVCTLHIYAKKDRNGPPSANQVASKDEPRRGPSGSEAESLMMPSYIGYIHYRP